MLPGTTRTRRSQVRNNLKAIHFYQVPALQIIALLASVAGNELRFAPLASGEGVVVSTGEGELELRYNTTVADTSLLDGLRMEVFSWWEGEHGLRVVSSVEDLGIIDTQDFDFRPNGVEVG